MLEHYLTTASKVLPLGLEEISPLGTSPGEITGLKPLGQVCLCACPDS